MATSDRLNQLFSFYEENPKDSFICFAIAKEYENLGAEDKALEFYLQLVKNDVDYVGTYYHLGKLYERKQDFETAIQTYQSGMAVAKKMGDRHALSELAGAKMEIEE